MRIRRYTRLLLVLLLASGFLAPVPPTPVVAGDAAAGERPVAFMLELAGPSVAAVYAANAQSVGAAGLAAATQTHLAALLAAQHAVHAALAQRKIPVLYALQRVYNGMAVRIPAAEAAQLATLPGVVAIHPITPKRPGALEPLTLLGTPALWGDGSTPGLRGEGLRLAVIDTGIDYLHTHFAGPGTGYAQNDAAVVGDVAGFPGPRVVGGYDFVGDSYNADPDALSYQPVARPDGDPMDCYGHGTHVAGAAAGSGVIPGGATYTGAYDLATTASPFEISPGVAPQASIYALKIFGCYGSSEFTDVALEWAVDPNGDGDFRDRMDVVNLSLGSPYGSAYDTSMVAADNAAAAGVVVVASAGNSGDNHFIVSSPSTAGRAIAVAATQHFAASPDQAAMATDLLPTFTSRGPRRSDAALKPDLAAPGVAIRSAASGTGSGNRALSGTSMAAPHVAGAMVLLRQLHPDWSVEDLKALAMNSAMPVIRTEDALTSTVYSPVRVGAGRIDLARAAAAATIAMSIEKPGYVGVSFGAPEVEGTLQATHQVRVINRSAVTATYALSYTAVTDLPGATVDVEPAHLMIPPGNSRTVAVVLRADATQMRHVRDETAASLSAADEAWLAEETGHLWLWPEAGFTATLQPPDAGKAELKFDPATGRLDYAIRLTGLPPGAIAGAYIAAAYGDEVGLRLQSLALPASAAEQDSIIAGTLTLTAGEAQLLASGMMQVQIQLAEGGGTLLGPCSGALLPIHLPVYAAPRPVADLATTPALLAFHPTAQAEVTPAATLRFTGQGITGAAPPTDLLALVTPLELHLQSPNRRPADMTEAEQDRYDHADLKSVGAIAGPGGTAAPSEPMLYFGVATYAPWSTPNEVTVEVYLDTDRNGTDDYRLYNTDIVHASSQSQYSDGFVSVLEELATGRKRVQAPLNNMPASQFDGALYFSTAMVLPVRVGALKLDPTTPTGGIIDYRVETYSADRAGTIDVTPTLQVPSAAPALHIGHSQPTHPFLVALPGASMETTLDLQAYAKNALEGLLLLHHHNRSDRQAQATPVRIVWPRVIGLPLIGK